MVDLIRVLFDFGLGIVTTATDIWTFLSTPIHFWGISITPLALTGGTIITLFVAKLIAEYIPL